MEFFLLFLQQLHLFPVAVKNLGHIPALEARVGVDLGPVMHLVFQHHHQNSPTAQGAVGVYQRHPAAEPRDGRVLNTPVE